MSHDHDHIPNRRLAFAEGAALLLLAAFLVFSAWSGRLRFFVAPAYLWMPPAAAGLLLAMGAARLWSLRAAFDCGDHGGSASSRTLFAAVLIAPVVIGLLVNPQQFSPDGVRKRRAQAVARDAALERAIDWVMGVKRAAPKGDSPASVLPAEPTVVELADAVNQGHDESLAGRFVTVIGQCATDNGARGRRFDLYRLVVTCCVADATSSSIEVVGLPGVAVQSGQWLRVAGVLRFEGGDPPQLVLHAASISRIPAPSSLYL
jgi:uncharacterized repeat protein (TIGR03943 family)